MMGGTIENMAIETGKRKMKDEIGRDEDYELLVLLRHTTDALFRAREKELRKAGISRIQAAVFFILKTITCPSFSPDTIKFPLGLNAKHPTIKLCW